MLVQIDGISSQFIIDWADLIAPHFLIIFNSFLTNGIFPDDCISPQGLLLYGGLELP